jgi:hypothetical protein
MSDKYYKREGVEETDASILKSIMAASKFKIPIQRTFTKNTVERFGI